MPFATIQLLGFTCSSGIASVTDTNSKKDKAIMIYLGPSNRWQNIVPALNRHFRIFYHDLVSRKGPFLWTQLKAVISLFHVYRELRRLRKDNPSLIVMVQDFNPVNAGLGLVARSLGLPFFFRSRGGMWREVEDRGEFQPFPLRQLYHCFYSLCRRLVLSTADGIVPISEFNQNQILQFTGKSHNKVLPIVYEPIDFASFDKAPEGNLKRKLGIKYQGKIILTVTNFYYYRKYMAISHYLPAIVQVLEENSDWYFIIAGSGYSFEKGRSSIMEKVPQNMKDRVIFTGYYRPIEEAFRDSDIAVHLTFRETAPIVVLEAQAAKKPLIVNDFGGSPEMLQNRYNEVQCIISEISELYGSLKVLVNDRKLRESIGQRNREAVSQRFNFEKTGDDFKRCVDMIFDRYRL
jgi:glycosyltransferase involved in cell wall biosynthesis